MTQFTQHTGIILPLDIANIDTDNIIPKQFLQKTTRDNYGQYLFFNWRFRENTCNKLNLNFVLNKPQYKNASILLSRRNFGCGSSREHAVWALIDYGFRVIIAPSFADIFCKNSFINHLLLVTLPEIQIDFLFQSIQKFDNSVFCTVHLLDQIIYINNKKYFFKISHAHREIMLNNLDNISVTLQYNSIIKQYEENQPFFLQ